MIWLLEQPIGWLMFLVAVWTVAVLFIVLALVVFVPPLWRAGLAQTRRWLRPPAIVIDLEDRRRQLKAICK